MKGALRDKVHGSTKELGELILKSIDGKPEMSSGVEYIQQINIARFARVAPCERSEYGQFGNPVPPADLLNPSAIEGVEPWHCSTIRHNDILPEDHARRTPIRRRVIRFRVPRLMVRTTTDSAAQGEARPGYCGRGADRDPRRASRR